MALKAAPYFLDYALTLWQDAIPKNSYWKTAKWINGPTLLADREIADRPLYRGRHRTVAACIVGRLLEDER